MWDYLCWERISCLKLIVLFIAAKKSLTFKVFFTFDEPTMSIMINIQSWLLKVIHGCLLGRDCVTVGPDLQEAEEQGVDGHLVDGEEGGGDQVGGHRDQQGRQEREVELGQLLSHLLLIGDIEGQRRSRWWCHFKKEKCKNEKHFLLTFCQKRNMSV